MKAVKGFLLVIIGMAVVLTLFSLIMPSSVSAVRNIGINASRDSINRMITNLSSYPEWYPGLRGNQPEIAADGKSISWKAGDKASKLSVVNADSNSLRLKLESGNSEPVISDIFTSVYENEPGVNVEWKLHSKVKWYPWERFGGIFFDQVSGPSMEEGLKNLKNLLER